jgi:hypothetical protein
MPGFNTPRNRPSGDPLASAAHRAGLTLRHQHGTPLLCRFGHHVFVHRTEGRWWITTPGSPVAAAVGPYPDEDALMRGAATELDALRASSREPLVRGQ